MRGSCLEIAGVVIATWLVLGWVPGGRAITQVDGSMLVAPFVHEAVTSGGDWARDLYRFGAIGGSEMAPFGGAMPLVELCARLGASTTLVLDIVTWFVQVALAFFAIVSVESLARVRLAAPARIAVTWLAAFAPVVGWRLGIGHENLLLGYLPLLAALALMLAAHSERLTRTALAFAAFAVANGVAGLGVQTVVYGALFGAPIVAAAIAMAPRGQRWTRERVRAIVALAAGVLVVAPRLALMVAHATGDDATRGLGESVVYAWGTTSWRDWLASIPWTDGPARAFAAASDVHEHNYPLGPIVVLAIAMWPRAVPRRLAIGLAVAAALAIVLGDDLAPVSTAMLRALPILRAFRVPARAALAVALVVPTLAAAAWAARAPADTRAAWLGVLAGVAIVLASRVIPPWPREALAWLACGAVVVLARRGLAPRVLAGALAPIAALGIAAFADRLPRDIPADTVDGGPAALHDAVVAQLPATRSPLVRVEVVNPPGAFALSTAWVGHLGSLDGLWYPPRRYLDLFSALVGEPISPLTCNFEMWRSEMFAIYQQLYDVVAVVHVSNGRGSVETLPPPAGPAWFPARVGTRDDAEAIASELRLGPDLHERVVGAAWLRRGDPGVADVPASDPACARARVGAATVDADGQVATIAVDAPATCVLVIAANYTSRLRATATVGGAAQPAAVVPIDIALIGVVVPAGATSVEVAPDAGVPRWTYLLAWLGFVALGAALLFFERR